jgi:hypothetical protein
MAWALTRNKIQTNAVGASLVWHVDQYSELTGFNLENLDKYLMPFNPQQESGIRIIGLNGETITRMSDFIRRYERQIPRNPIVIQMPQSEVMNSGYGRNIKIEDFPLVNAFLDNKITEETGSSLPQSSYRVPLNAGSYSFRDLLNRRALVDNRIITERDQRITTSFYGGAISLRTNDWFEDAYVHGTVGFALMNSTQFIVATHYKRVDAEVGALHDNWDLQSDAGIAMVVNGLVNALGLGVYNNQRIGLQYYGAGKRLSITR